MLAKAEASECWCTGRVTVLSPRGGADLASLWSVPLLSLIRHGVFLAMENRIKILQRHVFPGDGSFDLCFKLQISATLSTMLLKLNF